MRREELGIGFLFDSIRDAVIVGDATTGRIVLWNPAAEALFGYSASEAVQLLVEDLMPERLRDQCRAGMVAYAARGNAPDVENGGLLEWTAVRKDGEEFAAEISLGPVRGGSKEDRLVVAMVRDITRRKDLERQLEERSLSDGLTGIANRRRFDEVLEKEWRRATREPTSLALLMIDIDHFKDYNDALGHLAGDDCLRQVAQALEHTVRRAGDLVARYGGEEFAVLLPNTSMPAACDLAEKMRARVEDLQIPHTSGRPCPYLTVSIGVAVVESAVGDVAIDLISAADDALYQAKGEGRNRVSATQLSRLRSFDRRTDEPGWRDRGLRTAS
ncbi:MAG: response regulator receiver modulated diguanylate cyclase [Chloroflexi bacterium]|nr:response regulator receiver modulated diguanylate cyclase [Chloroflexota bacterium]